MTHSSDNVPTAWHWRVAVIAHSIAGGLLLAPPFSTIGQAFSGFVIGIAVGAVVGYGAATRQIAAPLLGAVFGVLISISVGFGVTFDGRSNLLVLRFGSHWLVTLVVVQATVGSMIGLAARSEKRTLKWVLAWPLVAIGLAVISSAWPMSRDAIWISDLTNGANRMWSMESEWIVGVATFLLLVWSLFRLALSENRLEVFARRTVLFYWPLLTGLSISQPWLLNHAGGIGAQSALIAVDRLFLGLIGFVVIINLWYPLSVLPRNDPGRELKFCAWVITLVPWHIFLVIVSKSMIVARI